MLLEQNNCEPSFLFEKDFEYYLRGILSMKFSEVPSFDNIKSSNEFLRIGKQYVKTVCYVDVEKIELPSEIEPYSYLGGNGSASDTAVDNFTFINDLEDYNTIVYNQIISIPSQAQQQRDDLVECQLEALQVLDFPSLLQFQQNSHFPKH